LALYLKGASVTLVSSRGYENLPKDIYIKKVNSSNEMFKELENSIKNAKESIEKKPYFFMVAAVSDYIPSSPKEGKLKKDFIGKEWSLELKQNIDILNSLNKEDIISIGFKAEMDENMAFDNAKNMIDKKSLDGVCLNIINEKNNFGSNNNEIELILKENSVNISGEKVDVSFKILKTLEVKFDEC